MDKQMIIAGFAIVLFMAAGFAIYAATHRPVYKRKGQMLLLNEQRFLNALVQALPPNTIVSFKVRLLDIVAVHTHSGKPMHSNLADYCVDFVIMDRDTTDVKLCIEMDMESKNANDRLNKNTMISRALRRAGIPHIRLPLVRFYDPARIRHVINETIAAYNRMPEPTHAQPARPLTPTRAIAN